MSKKDSQDLLCWKTKGRVGARMSTFDLEYFCKAWEVNKMPIIVFPNPVGKTIKEFLLLHFLNILSWYCR